MKGLGFPDFENKGKGKRNRRKPKNKEGTKFKTK